MKKKIVLLFSAMVLIAFMGSFLINIIKYSSASRSSTAEKKLNIVTTFYPIYLIGLNVADRIDALDVKSLTQLNTGCLHDYQLTTEDMKLISNADLLIINGGGMESFLEDVKTNYPDLTIIDASQGITLLSNETEQDENKNDGFEHVETGHDEAGHDETEQAENEHDVTQQDNGQPSTSAAGHDDDHEHSHEHDHGEYNAHVWLDPELYMMQIERVRDGLIDYINNHELEQGIDNISLINQLNENADNYISSVESVNQEMELFHTTFTSGKAEANRLPKAVVFHDSFAYLANKVGIDIAYTIPLDSDTVLSAGDIAGIIDQVNQENIKYLFTEQQYSDSIAKQIAEETNAKVYIIDSVVTGNAKKDSYLTAMRSNLEVLKAASNDK
jgi:zinc transport system substrate-binding protein